MRHRLRWTIALLTLLFMSAPLGAAAFAAQASPTDSAQVDSASAGEASWLDRLINDETIDLGLRIALGIALFVAGWILAKLVAWAVYRALLKTDADERLAKKLGFRLLAENNADPTQGERMIARVVYYTLMLLVVIAVMQYAGLTQAAGPIQSLVEKVMAALPFIGKAAAILGVAYLAALILSKVVTKSLDAAGVDTRFAELSAETKDGDKAADDIDDGPETKPFSRTAGRVVFWLIMVCGLAGAVDALDIAVLAEPLRNAIDRVITLLPAVAIAVVLVVAGYILGRIARTVLDNLLDSVGLNRLIARAELDKFFGKTRASYVVGWIAMAFIILQAAIAALNEVHLETLSAPLTDMMAQFWSLLPALAVSAVFIIAGVIGGRLLRVLVERVLDNIGFDDLLGKIGFGDLPTENEKLKKPHQIVGLIAQIAVVLVAAVQALENIELYRWAGYVSSFLGYAVTRAGVALVIVGVGFLVGHYLRDLILSRQESDEDEGVRWTAAFARYVVLVFAFTMAIAHLGVGHTFVLIAFALLFGSLCLAVALALGLGSREVAGDIVRRQYERARQNLRLRSKKE